MRRLTAYVLQLALVALLSALAGPASASAISLAGGHNVVATTTTFIDLLSSDERFSEFLHTVQRLRMVIPLNRVRNATLLVPTNEALRRYRKRRAGDTTHIAGAVYQGVSDDQAWYHLIGDRAIWPEELVRGEMVWESYSKPWDDGTLAQALGDGDDDRGGGDGEEKRSSGVMLKTWISSDYSVLANGVPVLAQNYSCSAGSVYMIDGLLAIPPTIRDVLQQQQAAAAESGNDGDKEARDRAEGGEFSAVERLLSAAGWSHILDMPGDGKGGSDKVRQMHTLWAFGNRAFAAELSYAERSYLLYGPEFAKDDDELHRMALEDTRSFASAFVSPGPVSIARLGVGKHKVPGFEGGTDIAVVIENGPGGGGLSARVNGQPVAKSDVVARN
ncbi:hypothetical protein LPJ75_005733, partial [Coemansia sp. RSA 2598]